MSSDWLGSGDLAGTRVRRGGGGARGLRRPQADPQAAAGGAAFTSQPGIERQPGGTRKSLDQVQAGVGSVPREVPQDDGVAEVRFLEGAADAAMEGVLDRGLVPLIEGVRVAGTPAAVLVSGEQRVMEPERVGDLPLPEARLLATEAQPQTEGEGGLQGGGGPGGVGQQGVRGQVPLLSHCAPPSCPGLAIGRRGSLWRAA